SAVHVGEPEWEEDIRRLRSLSQEFAYLWDRHEVAGPEQRTRRFQHRRAGLMSFTTTEFDLPTCPEVRMVVYTPADEPTRSRLPLTRRPGPASPALARAGPATQPRRALA